MTIGLLAITLAAGLNVIAAAPSSAAGACGDRSKNSIKRYYQSRAGRIPLRCGTWDSRRGRGFGVRKLEAKRRYNIWYQGMIGATLESPRSIKAEGTTFNYRTAYFEDCDPIYRFKVVVQTKNVGGTRLMRGVITAYKEFK